MAPTDPRLRAALAAAEQETAEAVASLRSLADGIRSQHQRFRDAAARQAEERAQAARHGELGPDLQRLQERIDRHETTWEDALEGRDQHPSAVAVRGRATRNLAVIAEEVRSDPEFVEQDLETRRAEARVRAERDG